jgi:hypothetical protein
LPRSIASRPRPPEAIIIGLFLLQRLGTGAVGRLSGPVMGIWFAAIGAIGVHGVAAHPEIFKALLPTYALDFLAGHFSTFQPPRGSKSMASSTKTTGSSTSPARFGHMAEPNVPGLLPLIRKALDSIPAVFGVTDQPYIVFAANAFALLGLRARFFLVTGLLDRLVYLSSGLALIWRSSARN